MAHKQFRFLGVVAAAMVLAVACGGTSGGGTPTKTFKIGLVTDIGGLNDKSFNHLADVGLEKAKAEFKIQADVKESKSGDDYVPNLTDFATKNYDLVIGVGFLMQEAVGTVSGTFPNVHFSIIDGAGTDAKGVDLKHSNVQSLFFKEQDAGAMVGVIAGGSKRMARPRRTSTWSARSAASASPRSTTTSRATSGRRRWKTLRSTSSSVTRTTSPTRPSARVRLRPRSGRALTSSFRLRAAAGLARCRPPARPASTASAWTQTRRTPTRPLSPARSRKLTWRPTPRSRMS